MTATTTSTTRQYVRSLIRAENSSNQVVMYAKSYCPHCAQAKALFRSLPGMQVKVHEIDLDPNGSFIQDELLKLTGQRTVPNIFVNNKHVGGNSDIQHLHQTGQLEEMLKKTKQQPHTDSTNEAPDNLEEQNQQKHQATNAAAAAAEAPLLLAHGQD